MTDINFDCPHCKQNLEAPKDMSGLFIECPTCQKVIKVPLASDRPPAAGADTAEFRPAPPRPKEPEEKSSTMRIELPPGLGVPETPRRRIVFRRGSK